MRPRGLLLAVIFLLALGVGIWWSNKKQAADSGKPPADAPPKILTLNEADLTKIALERKDGEATTIERDSGGGWRITAPSAFAADRDAVNGLVTSLSSVSADKVIEEKPSDVGQFGLAQPALRAVLTLKGGKTRTLSLGDDTPVGGGAFARVDGDARVFTIASYTKTGLDKKAADLRDRRLLTFDSAKLARVELTARGAAIEFSKNNQNEWTIVKPGPVRADNWQVEELIRKLGDAKLDATLTPDQQKDLAKQFAASAPLSTVAVTDAAGRQALEVRKNKDNKYYAKSSAVDGFHLLTEDAGKGFDKSVDDFRNKKLFDFAFNDPTKVDYRSPARQLSLSKSGDRWLYASKPMDSVGVQSLIDRLRDLSATKFPESGFTTPLIELGVVSKEGKLTEKVSISKNGERYVARRDGEPALYELDAKTVDELQKAATDVKEQPPEKKSAKK